MNLNYWFSSFPQYPHRPRNDLFFKPLSLNHLTIGWGWVQLIRIICGFGLER
jgi:hypothetical protein